MTPSSPNTMRAAAPPTQCPVHLGVPGDTWAANGESSSTCEVLLDNLDLAVSPETAKQVNNVETKVTYWAMAAEMLQQLSFVPRAIERHATGVLSFLKLYKSAKLTTYFELCERGSAWMKLDPAALQTLAREASHLNMFESAGLRMLRGMGRVLPWVAPMFATWDVMRAGHEHNAYKRTALIGNATLSVVAAAVSICFPLAGLVICVGQCVDSSSGQRFSRWLGRTIQGEWAARGGK